MNGSLSKRRPRFRRPGKISANAAPATNDAAPTISALTRRSAPFGGGPIGTEPAAATASANSAEPVGARQIHPSSSEGVRNARPIASAR